MSGTLVLLAAVAVFTLWRYWTLRQPSGVSDVDPPGIRSIAMFEADAPELLAEDNPDDLLVGRRLFERLCQGVGRRGAQVVVRDRLQNAQRAVCEIDDARYAMVLEWLDPTWAVSIEWAPATSQQQRHQNAAQAVYAPEDGPGLRRLLAALHGALIDDPLVENVTWHRRQDWSREIWDKGRREPLET